MRESVDPEVLVTIDNGLSGTRVLWNVPGQPINFMRISPEILEVNSRNLLDDGLAGGKPEDNAFITLDDGSQFAVGKAARDLRGVAPVAETKYQSSAFKIVAAVGAIATHLGVRELTLTISTLLPFSEYQDRNQFVELLGGYLRKFSFCGTGLHCAVKEVIVKPEGAGIAINYMNSTSSFDDENTLVFMLGHRDASLLAFEDGAPSTGIGDQPGDQLGFLELQKQVVKRAALNLTAKNQSKLPEYLFRSKLEPEYVEKIARMAVTGRAVSGKIEDLEEAIRNSQIWYVETLTQWIRTTLGPFLGEVDHVLISGGTAFYLEEELTEFFQSQPKLNREGSITWGGLTNKEEIETLLGRPLEPDLAVRLADVSGLYMDTVAEFPRLAPSAAAEHGKAFDADEALEETGDKVEAATVEPVTNGRSTGGAKQPRPVDLPALPKTAKARTSRRG